MLENWSAYPIYGRKILERKKKYYIEIGGGYVNRSRFYAWANVSIWIRATYLNPGKIAVGKVWPLERVV